MPNLRLALVFLLALLTTFAAAHPANVASSQIKVKPDGTFVAKIRFDLAAFATGATPKDATDEAMNAFADGDDVAMQRALADAEARFNTGFTPTIDRLEFTQLAEVRQYLAANPKPRFPMMMSITVVGHVPKGSRTIAFRYPEVMDTVIQTVEFAYTEPISEPVEAGNASSTLTIPTEAQIAKLEKEFNAPRKAPEMVPLGTATKVPATPKKPSASVRGNRGGGGVSLPRTAPLSTPGPVPQKNEAEPKTQNLKPKTQNAELPKPQNPILTYLRMGFTHILPEGLDHILFVLGLFLLGSNTKALIKQITAFTIAHSITLALATLNIVRVPGSITEPLIAISIAFVAIENFFIKDVKPWRIAVVFLFGLIHGMGFAEVFKDAGLSGGGLITALLSFNVGVELGQLSVVGLAFLLVGWFRKDERYRQYVVLPASLVIAVTALFWTVQRIFF
jgi:hypothetical protein